MKKKTTANKTRIQTEFPFLNRLTRDTSGEAADNLRGWLGLYAGEQRTRWHGDNLLPPGTLLERVCESFRRGSDVPLEIPFAVTLALVAGWATQQGHYSTVVGSRIDPNIWLVCLADSGWGKSFVAKQLKDELGLDSRIPGIEGAAGHRAFFDALNAQPQGLWLQDEFGQFIRHISAPQQAQWKAMMLAAGTGEDIAYGTKADGNMLISSPRVALLGLSQTGLWRQHNPPENMLDGLLARFSFLIAERDPTRPARNYWHWIIDRADWGEAWQRVQERGGKHYDVEPEALRYFAKEFRRIFPIDLPDAFSRRILYRTHQYALIYGVLRASPTLGLDEYGYAIRLTLQMLSDTRRLVGDHALSDLARLLAQVEGLAQRYATEHRSFSARDMVIGVRGIANTAMAQGVFRFLWPQYPRFKIPAPSMGQ